jgi:hypothetical protein
MMISSAGRFRYRLLVATRENVVSIEERKVKIKARIVHDFVLKVEGCIKDNVSLKNVLTSKSVQCFTV